MTSKQNPSTSFAASRRDVLTGALALGLTTGTALSLPVVAGMPIPPPGGGLPDFSDPAVNLRHIVRMQGSVAEEDVPWWFTGVIFGVRENETPRPLFRFEGLEIYWFEHVPDGYLLGGHTVTFFRDYETNEFLHEFDNPYTGKTNTVKPAVQGGSGAFHYGEQGIRWAATRDDVADKPLQLQWHAMRDYVWMQHQTVYPKGMPPMHGQRQTMSVPREKFLDTSIDALPSMFSSTVFMGWLRWLEMKDEPGHLIWHASGAKLRTIADLPADYRARAEKEFPERMTAKPPVKPAA